MASHDLDFLRHLGAVLHKSRRSRNAPARRRGRSRRKPRKNEVRVTRFVFAWAPRLGPPRPSQQRNGKEVMTQLRGSRVLVTGASYGIGAATALATARKGARLILWARTAEALHATARAIADAGG